MTDYSIKDHKITQNQLASEIINTNTFKRLKNISFLGAIEYLSPQLNNKFHHTHATRYEHSLGVASLAYHYALKKNLSLADTNLILATTLLHDIGHAPFSHSLEPLFYKKFNINHHIAGTEIIKGMSPLGDEIKQILKTHHVAIDEVVSLFEGQSHKFDGFFSGPVTFDALDGIFRTLKMTKNNDNHIVQERNNITFLEAAISRTYDTDKALLDHFWHLKQTAYKTIIQSPEGLYADALSCAFLNDNMIISRSDYFLTESEMRRKYVNLDVLMNNLYDALKSYHITVDDEIHYRERIFLVQDDKNRYHDSKRDAVYNLSEMKEKAENRLYDLNLF